VIAAYILIQAKVGQAATVAAARREMPGEALQRVTDASDLHQWEMSLR
jgi:hypothetical protein